MGQAGALSQEEIEVTPAMIEAGIEAFSFSEAEEGNFDVLLARVFRGTIKQK